MSGHNGYGATRRGHVTKGEPFHVPADRELAVMAKMAIEARQIAAQLGIPVREALTKMRADALFDATDEQFAQLVVFAEM